MGVRGLFVTGTDTDVGKTWVSCLAVRQLREAGHSVGVYKPACSGATTAGDGLPVWEDVRELAAASEMSVPDSRICPQRFTAPLAPPVAAAREGLQVDSGLLRSGAAWWRGRADCLVVEGVGGLLCPLTGDEVVADVAADLGFPLLIVARGGLGTINHALLTLESAQRAGWSCAGLS